MRYRTTLLLYFVVVVRCYAINNTSMELLVIETVQDLCPGANICRGNRTVTTQESTSELPCCSECSCTPDCHDKNNCCFPNTHTDISIDNKEIHVGQTKQSCLFPVTYLHAETSLSFYQSYVMIDHIANDVSAKYKSDVNISCGDVTVAPWGSLYPVYSDEKQKIYKNLECAIADGVTDGEKWNVITVCGDFYKDASNFVIGVDSDTVPGTCFVEFEYRGNIKDLNPLKCFDDFISTCPKDDFEIVSELNMSKRDIVNMCESGFLSPYSVVKQYSNVFCYICGGNAIIIEQCLENQNDKDNAASGRGFLALIDERVLNEAKMKTKDYPEVCNRQNIGHCKPVHCPSGQVRVKSGMCRFPHTLWYNQEYTVFLNLTSSTAINISDIFKFDRGRSQNFLPPFRIPWPDKWFIFLILAEKHVLNETSGSTSLLLGIRSNKQTVKPKEFIHYIKIFSKRSWSLPQNNGSTLLFNSNIAPYAFADIKEQQDDHLIVNGEIRKTHFPLTSLYRKSPFSSETYSITKLYFCEQVEMTQNEFVLSLYKSTMLELKSKRHFLGGEFAIVNNNAYEEVRVRICIDNSEMIDKFTFSGVNMNLDRCRLWTVLVVLVHMIVPFRFAKVCQNFDFFFDAFS